MYAVNDATKMRDYLQSIGFSVSLLLNQDATKETIEFCLGDSLKWKVASYDRVLVFFAGIYLLVKIAKLKTIIIIGHVRSLSLGQDAEEIYLLPYDADPTRLVSKVSFFYLFKTINKI